MMRSKVTNSAQSSGSNDQKKSVFDRLGRQLDAGRSMKRRPSPGQYGEYMPPPQVHEAEFNRYPRDPHTQAEMEWRYQNERRHIQFSRERHHPGQLQPPPPPHYEIEMSGRQPPYYPHPYHGGQPNPGLPPPPMGPGNLPMNMHSQRSSPKYDRHGNIIMNFKEGRGGPMRMGPMDHHSQMSPPRGFLPPGPIMQGPNDMPPMRPGAAYMGPGPSRGWMPDGPMDPPEFPPMHGRMILPDGRFSPIGSRRMQQQQQQQQMMGKPGPNPHGPGPLICEAPRYTKWRERRDVITNLDRETAQSSSRTDSLKSSLQQDTRVANKNDKSLNSNPSANNSQGLGSQKTSKQQAATQLQKSVSSKTIATDSSSTNLSSSTNEKGSSNKESSDIKKTKAEPQDISDGEIVDDEDSSDDSETIRPTNVKTKDSEPARLLTSYQGNRNKSAQIVTGAYVNRGREPHQYYESSGKKRRMLEREDYSMDYETISDEDLDDFMGDRKNGPNAERGDAKSDDSRAAGDESCKSLSEVELLNALGLDWANLVEMARQSRACKEFSSTGSGLSRFQMSNYLPTLGLTADLVGPKLYDLVLKVCRSC